MKILFVTATYKPSINGVAISVDRTFNQLKKLGHTVHVLAPKTTNGNGKEYEDEDSDVIRYPSVENILVKDYPFPVVPLTPKIYKKLSKVDYDIVHTHHPYHIAYFAELISKRKKSPFVFTYHTLYNEYSKSHFEYLPEKISDLVMKFSVDKVCENANAVIAPSQKIKDTLDKKFDPKKIFVVPTGIKKFPQSKISKEQIFKKYGLDKNKRILLTVNRLSPEKNISLLIESMPKINENAVLVIAGSGSEKKNLEELSQSLGVSKRVFFLGPINHENLGEVYSMADVYLFPSTTETQGLTILEAFSEGKFIVAVESEISHEWIPAEIGLLSQNNAQDFSNKVNMALEKDLNSLEKKCVDFSQNYTIEKTTQKLLQVYESLL